MSKKVNVGTRWTGNNNDYFRVINVVDVDGHTWVHYRQDRGLLDNRTSLEYSCYVESFVQRFREVPDDQPKTYRV